MSTETLTSNTSPPLPSTQPSNTPAARLYTHVHPILVLGTFVVSFSSVVADPVSALHALSYPLAALQAAYCVVCLPQARTASSNYSSAGPFSTPLKPSRKSGARYAGALSSRVTSAILSLLLTLILAVPALAALIVLHGAPLTTHHVPTILLALHVSLLAAPPLFYTHGVSAVAWRGLVSLNVGGVDEVVAAAAGALVGAWVGAVPIPLDWDREWQRWPVTVVAGAYGGWAVGKFAGRTMQSGVLGNWGNAALQKRSAVVDTLHQGAGADKIE